MTRTLAIAAVAATLALGGCATQSKLPVITKNNYIAVTIDAPLLDLNSCPWPEKPVDASEAAISDYMLNGFKAWACENDTRGTIKKQVARQEQDIADRNADKQPGTTALSAPAPVAPVAVKPKKSWISFK